MNNDNKNQKILDIGYSILIFLNELNIEYGTDHNEFSNNTQLIFRSKMYDSDEVVEALLYRIKHKQIRHFSQDYNTLLKSIQNKKTNLINDLRNGLLLITEFGMAYIVSAETSKTIYKSIIEREKVGLEKLKDNLFIQIFALMGIFVAIITFIFQGITFLTNKDFFFLCFWQKILAATALYIPLLITIFIIIILSFLIILLNNIIKKIIWKNNN